MGAAINGMRKNVTYYFTTSIVRHATIELLYYQLTERELQWLKEKEFFSSQLHFVGCIVFYNSPFFLLASYVMPLMMLP